MNDLIHIDQTWLLAINNCHATWADTLFWWVSDRFIWLPLYAVLVGLIFWRFGWKKALWILFGFAVAVGLSDWVSSGLIKPWVARLRPTHEPALEGLVHIVKGYTGGLYGFVSSHAANTMACALLFSLIWRKKIATCLMMTWVALNCYSRMYLGVHYPGDIMGGLLVGALWALVVYAGLFRLNVVGEQSDAGDDVDRSPSVCS